MSRAEYLEWLKSECAKIGSQSKAAKEWGVSAAYLCQVLREVRPPSEKLVRATHTKVYEVYCIESQ